MTLTDNEMLELIGDPDEIERDLESFRRNAEALTSVESQQMTRYANRWVAIFNGGVAASAPTFKELIDEMRAHGIPQGKALLRYIEETPRKLIL